MSHLRDLQLRFQDENAIAEHRLGTYYNAYRIRLIDCLAVDYSALEKYLGREAFENMALDYLQHFPSSHPSVRWFGENLSTYLRDIYSGKEAEFLEELARYEWSQTLVFDAADSAQLLQLEDMAAVPANAWPGLTLKFKPALIWLDLFWNVPLIEDALDSGTEVPQKQRDDLPHRWMLWRHDSANFAAICEGLLEWIDEQQVALVAAGFLKQWVGDQLVLKLDND
jgi:hypothetical protein